MKESKEEIVKQDKAEEKNDNAENNSEDKKPEHISDVDLLKGIIEKYQLEDVEEKIINKVISLLETTKTRQMLPPQNVGDSVFKMYDADDDEPTEFIVDRIEFDDLGWKLVSYEKFGVCEIDFVFAEKDYNKFFFDTAEDAKAALNKK